MNMAGRYQCQVARRAVMLFALLAGATLCVVPIVSATQPSSQPKPLLVSIGSILESEQSGPPDGVLLRGTITYTRGPVVMQDQTGAIELLLPENFRQALIVGDEVEVAGTKEASSGWKSFSATSAKILSHSSLPLPLAITPDRAADGRYNLHLVQTTGVVTHIEKQGQKTILSLQGDHQFFTARVETSEGSDATGQPLERIEAGSSVRLGGVLLATPRVYSSADGSFVLLVHSPDDLAVLHGPSWWNVRHVSFLFAFCILLGGTFQALHLQQVKRRYNAVLAERARIARDIHDTLAQGFAGIALQMEVVRGMMPAGDSATQHLDLALRMVQHSRAEAHRSIAALRAFSQDMPLQTMLEEMMRHLQDIPGQQVDLRFHGNCNVLLPPSIAENVYRIAQELLSNAQQHASATLIHLTIAFAQSTLIVTVEDNGVGIDPGLLQNPPPGHFGLIGLRERVQSMRGRVQLIRRMPGTSAIVEIPVKGLRLTHRGGVPLSYGPSSPSWKVQE